MVNCITGYNSYHSARVTHYILVIWDFYLSFVKERKGLWNVMRHKNVASVVKERKKEYWKFFTCSKTNPNKHQTLSDLWELQERVHVHIFKTKTSLKRAITWTAVTFIILFFYFSVWRKYCGLLVADRSYSHRKIFNSLPTFFHWLHHHHPGKNTKRHTHAHTKISK